VVAANFLIDAESNLKAALAGFTADAGSLAAPARPSTDGASHGTEGAGPAIGSGHAADTPSNYGEQHHP